MDYKTFYKQMKKSGKSPKVTPTLIKITVFLFILILSVRPALCQNIVLNVTGKVLVNGQAVKKGANLGNNATIVFSDSNAELKVLGQPGVCVIKYKNYEQKRTSELLELIKFSIRKNSVATLGTRTWKVNPDKGEQLKLVDSLCRTLNVTRDNVEEIFSQYITRYCVLEFETPFWQDIARFLQTKYGFNPAPCTGALMTPDQYQSIPLVPKVRSIKPIPVATSLKQYCPIPGDQGRYGTCTGWASAYGARTISWAVKNNLTDVQDITNQAFSPSFVYTRIKNSNDPNCQLGGRIDKSVEVLKEEGVVFLTDLPYQCDADVSPFVKQAKAYAIKDFQRLTDQMGLPSEGDLDNIKKALADNKPVIGCIKCYQSFMSSKARNLWNGVADNVLGYHAVCLTGYDDHFDNGDGTLGAVELMNSWGTVWGNGGFIHIKYQDFRKILYSAVSLYDDVRPVPPPEPPKPQPLPPHTPKPLPIPSPKPLPAPSPVQDTKKRMEGSLTFLLNDGSSMKAQVDEAVTRNYNLVSVERMTYNIQDSYPSGTMFRIQFTSSQPAYVYVISTDSKRSPLAQLFPDPERNISALIDFKSEVSVSIPDETQYIQMDDSPGEDYLCVIYSKEEININEIKNSMQNNPLKSFVQIVKDALAGKVVDEKEVIFEKDRIAFDAASDNHTAIPIFIKTIHKR